MSWHGLKPQSARAQPLASQMRPSAHLLVRGGLCSSGHTEVQLTCGRLQSQCFYCCRRQPQPCAHRLPMATLLWNLAIRSLCQEPRTFWVPTFHSPLKGLPFSCMSGGESEGSGSGGTRGGSGREARRPGSCAESCHTLSHHLPFLSPLPGKRAASLSKASPSFKALLVVPPSVLT